MGFIQGPGIFPIKLEHRIEHKKDHEMVFGFCGGIPGLGPTYFWFTGNDGMEKKNGTCQIIVGLYLDYYEDPILHSLRTRGKLNRVAVTEHKLSYHIGETILLAIYPSW